MRLQVEVQVGEVARIIAKAMPPGHGFALFSFEFGAGGTLAYASNGTREDVVAMLKEWLAQVEAK